AKTQKKDSLDSSLSCSRPRTSLSLSLLCLLNSVYCYYVNVSPGRSHICLYYVLCSLHTLLYGVNRKRPRDITLYFVATLFFYLVNQEQPLKKTFLYTQNEVCERVFPIVVKLGIQELLLLSHNF
ncbi:hypothetical protein BDB00DRAFT_935902, partial [Zychaea mexicana]|uniref:uncharacterized protein n=1 Tax=Zychaea mexicana TaxID=64656 RepID=UPI0022FDFB2B